MTGELQLFCLWSKSRHAEGRILADVARELEIVYTAELEFPCRADVGFAAFYDVSVRTGARKAKNSGSGPFRLVIVRDPSPQYATCTVTGDKVRFVNPRIVDLKDRYLRWAGRRWSVHATQDQCEFDRDVRLLTGHAGEDWRRGVPTDEIRPDLGLGNVREVYLFKNRFGRVLSFYTEDFIAIEPEIAARISPVPLADRAAYDVGARIEDYPDIRVMVARGAVAGLFYPAKRDDVRTVFFIENGRCFVKKTIGNRTKQRVRYGFRQLEIAPLPIYKGRSVRDLMAAAGTEEAMESVAVAFLDELRRQFPPLANGNLPERTFDAIPQNCIVDADGRYNFFDLEYEMIGGVPFAYLIERLVMATLPDIRRETGVAVNVWNLAETLARHFGIHLDWREYRRICRACKKFNTRSWRRVLTNIWLSVLPFRRWRERFCWWSSLPEVKT